MVEKKMKHIVIAGAGQAGLETAITLRELGYAEQISLLGDERHLPYERPPLSKTILRGEAEMAPLDADWEELGIDLRLGCRAERIVGQTVDTSEGPMAFDGLVIATGATPVNLPDIGCNGDVHTLRTIDDAVRLRSALLPGARVVIIGAGWIGAEVATAAAARGCAVTVVEAAPVPLMAALPAAVGERTIPWYAEAGVTLINGAHVTALSSGQVHLADGKQLQADCVVVGIGVQPNTGWLSGSGIRLDGASRVLTDASLRTSRSDVVAVGDCTSWDSRRFGTRLHVEHWDNAQRAPSVAARALLGEPAVYDPVPYFWSESFGRMLQFAGHANRVDNYVLRGCFEENRWSVCWIRGGSLVAIFAVDRPRDVAQARKIIGQPHRVDPAELEDSATELKRICRA